MERILEPLLRRPGWVVGAWIVLAAAAAPGLLDLRLDNSPEGFFVRDHEALERYRETVEILGGPMRGLRVVVSGPSLWTSEGLEWIARFETLAPRIPGVAGAAGFYGHHHREMAAWPPDDPAAFRRLVTSDPLDHRAGWVSADGETATVLLALHDSTPEHRRRALAGLDELLAAAPPGLEVAPAGLPVANQALDAALVDWAREIAPVLPLLAALFLAVAFRRVADVALPLLFVGLCLVVVLGAMGRAGARIDVVTVLLVPLLFVIAVATVTHVQVSLRRRARSEPGLGARELVRRTYREKAWPLVWAGVTTAAGFGSLAASSVPPIRSLGLWSAAGLVLVTLAAFTLLPSLLVAAGSPDLRERKKKVPAWRPASWAIARRRRVLVAFGLAAVVCAGGLARLNVDTRLLSYFSDDDPLRRAVERLDAAGLGAVHAELWLRGRDWSTVEELERLSGLSAELRSLDPVRGVVGPAEIAPWVLRAASATGGERPAGLTWFQWNAVLQALPPRADPPAARLSLFVPLAGHDELEPAFEAALDAARRHLPGVEAWLTGPYPLVLAAQRSLLRTLWLSLGLTALVVASVLAVVLRAPRRTLAALATNLFPVLAVLGGMGWIGVPVDSSTVMIAAVILGLAVDDTFHTFGRLRRESGDDAAARAVEAVAPAHLLTTLVLATGFAVCGLSGLVPVSRFGILASAALVVALLADVLLLPALLRKGRRRLSASGGSGEREPPR